MEKYYQQFENCIQHEIPLCQDSCPFRMDVLDFQEKITSGRFDPAYKILRNAMGFPAIAAELCPQYCRSQCLLEKAGGAVQLNMLEKSCIAQARRKTPPAFNLPAKGKSIAIIGGGISGLACALRTASKGYDVTIYEKTGRLGGSLTKCCPPN